MVVTIGGAENGTANGDVFEMEDQRNWTDASYKTYVRPLALPWPYTLEAGTELEQAVTPSLDWLERNLLAVRAEAEYGFLVNDVDAFVTYTNHTA
mgnify:CR=1 FL=1